MVKFKMGLLGSLGMAAAAMVAGCTAGSSGRVPVMAVGAGASVVPEGYGLVRRHVLGVDAQNNEKVVLTKVLTVATVDTIENSTNVKAVTRMTDYKGIYEADMPCVSPDNRKVLFQLLEENESINLWTMSATTGLERIRNTEGNYFNFYGVFSAKGDTILFCSNRTDPNSHIWEIKAHGGGGGLRRITESRETDMWVHADPLGQPIMAYTRFPLGSTRGTIWTYDRTTYLSTQLREGREPRISPNSQRILFSAFDEQEGHWNIWVMDVNGAHPTKLTSNDADNITPSWHPSGEWIIFASNKGSVTTKARSGGAEYKHYNFDIWMMKANGEHVSQLTENGSDDDHPVFSPDGKSFYFSSNRGHAVENLAADEMARFRARGDTTSIQGVTLPIGTGRDIWRATVADDVLRDNIGTGGK